VHLLPHWNWPDRVGAEVPVYVYTNGDSAELFLNGNPSPEIERPPGDKCHRSLPATLGNVIYAPGELKAVAHEKGARIGEAVGPHGRELARLRLTPDPHSLESSGEDLCYVLVEAVDKDGNSARWR